MLPVNPRIAGSALIRRPGIWICLACRQAEAQTRRRLTILARPNATNLERRPLKSLSRASLPTIALRNHLSTTPRLESDRKLSRKPVLPDGPVRTRFAPSPTGDLHIGGLRTALFSYLIAKRTGGKFLVRIEDTDQKRLVPGAEERLLENLRWAGLVWDEGPNIGGPYGPYKQSERNEIYQTHAKELLDNGSAYRCFCTPQKVGTGDAALVKSDCYQDCSHLPAEKSSQKAETAENLFTVRLRPNQTPPNKRKYPDLIYGNIKPLKRSPSSASFVEVDPESGAAAAADSVLVKSDGTPTYHFANVVDDHLMNINLVIRGSEWMASTPLHYDLYKAFGWEPPKFAHVSLLTTEAGAKLSKRNSEMAMDVDSMKADYSPEALCNFLVLLGWSNPTRDDVMSMQELIEVFDLKFTKGNTAVQMKKLDYLRKNYVFRRAQKAVETCEAGPVREIVNQLHGLILREIPSFAQRFNTEPEQLEYITTALLSNSRDFRGTKQWVENNSYLFDFDSSPTLAAVKNIDAAKEMDGPSESDLDAFVLPWIETFDFQQPYREPLFHGMDDLKRPVKNKNLVMPPHVRHLGLRIEAAIDAEIWARSIGVPDQTPLNKDAEVPYHNDRPVDFARYIKHLHNYEADAAELKAIAERRDQFKSAVVKYLRRKLAYGKPGPSMWTVMALLGYQESCARLGVEGSENGW